MWEGGIHGSHEALLLGGSGGDHMPWLGQAAAAQPGFPYMVPPPFAEPTPAVPFGYCEGGGQYGLFGGVEPPAQGVGGGGGAQARGKAVVSGLFGSLQAEFGRMTAKEIMDAKALAASRSHSEAERRRRQRINGHLARLRSLLPNTTKTDKASLLAEVIEHVKELKRQTSAMMAAGGVEEGMAQPVQQLLPTEADELAVDAAADDEGRLVVRASLCCEDRPDLIPGIAGALAALRLRARRAEIATLGGRVRNVLLITAEEDNGDDEEDNDSDDEDGNGNAGQGDNDDDACAAATHRRHELVASIQEALRGVMDRKAASSDTSTSSGSGAGGIKRQRMNGAQEQGSV